MNSLTSTDQNTDPVSVSAAVLLVGNEILSGRTQDSNLAFIADALGERGIRVIEARVIPDIAEVIQTTLQELRQHADFVFTKGGIGPTHDDITAENVAAVFGVDLHTHPEAERRLLAYFSERGVEPNAARMRMAQVPVGATLVDNPVSIAPGFRMENVFVMAGVPKIMQAMLANILPELPQADRWLSVTVICDLPEGALAAPLGKLQDKHNDVDLGSYPGKTADNFRVALVARTNNQQRLDAVSVELRKMVADLGGNELSDQSL